MVPKTCILCQHFHFFAGEPDYSEVTPGTSWCACCRKNHFYMDGYDVSQKEYVENLKKAETCPDFAEEVHHAG